MERDSFVFYRSYYEAIRGLRSKDEQLDIYNAIFEYALNGTEPKEYNIAFELIRPQLDISYKKYLQRCETNRQNALKGKDKLPKEDCDS